MAESLPLRTSIQDAAAWRADMRGAGVDRRPPAAARDPDRQHVDRNPPPRRVVVLTTADKPPVIVKPAPPPTPAPAPPTQLALPPAPEPAPEGGRPFYNAQFRAEVVNDFYASRRVEAHLTQKAYADRIGVEQSTLSHWLADADREQRRKGQAERRQQRAAAAAARAPRAEPARSLDEVYGELTEAKAELAKSQERVDRLKDELRGLLDE